LVQSMDPDEVRDLLSLIESQYSNALGGVEISA